MQLHYPGRPAGISDHAVELATAALVARLDEEPNSRLVAAVQAIIDEAKDSPTEGGHTTLHTVGVGLALYFRGRTAQDPALRAQLHATFHAAFPAR